MRRSIPNGRYKRSKGCHLQELFAAAASPDQARGAGMSGPTERAQTLVDNFRLDCENSKIMHNDSLELVHRVARLIAEERLQEHYRYCERCNAGHPCGRSDELKSVMAAVVTR